MGHLFYISFQQGNYLCNNSEFSSRMYVFVAKHEVVVVAGLSRGRFPSEKACCLSSKTRERNVCRGRMIGYSTKMARVTEVDRGNFVCAVISINQFYICSCQISTHSFSVNRFQIPLETKA